MRQGWRRDGAVRMCGGPGFWLVGPKAKEAGGLAKGFAGFDARMSSGSRLPEPDESAGSLLHRAMERRIGEHDMPAIARLLGSRMPMVRRAGVCMLAEVEWKRVPMPSCEAMFDALRGVRDGGSPALADAARRVMVRMIEGVLWGDADEREKTA